MEELKPIAVKCTSNFGGIEILKIEYGITDNVIIRENYGTPSKPIKRKLRYTKNGKAYFNYNGKREHLDDYIRTNI